MNLILRKFCVNLTLIRPLNRPTWIVTKTNIANILEVHPEGAHFTCIRLKEIIITLKEANITRADTEFTNRTTSVCIPSGSESYESTTEYRDDGNQLRS